MDGQSVAIRDLIPITVDTAELNIPVGDHMTHVEIQINRVGGTEVCAVYPAFSTQDGVARFRLDNDIWTKPRGRYNVEMVWGEEKCHTCGTFEIDLHPKCRVNGAEVKEFTDPDCRPEIPEIPCDTFKECDEIEEVGTRCGIETACEVEACVTTFTVNPDGTVTKTIIGNT